MLHSVVKHLCQFFDSKFGRASSGGYIATRQADGKSVRFKRAKR